MECHVGLSGGMINIDAIDNYMKLRTLILILAFVWLDVAGQVKVYCPDVGWYRYGSEVWYSNGGVTWKMQNGEMRHERNTWAVGKYFIVESDGSVEGDTMVYGVALHEQELRNLCSSGRDFVGEAFTKNESEQEFGIEMPGAVNGTEATVRVRMAHAGGVTTMARVFVDGAEKGSMTMAAVTGEDCASASEGKWSFTVAGESVVVKIIYNVGTANGYLDWIEVNYEDARVGTSRQDNVRDAEVIGNVTLGRLHELGDAEIVIVSDAEMASVGERLGELHEAWDGLRYVTVRESEIFDEYGNGQPSDMAYREFMKERVAAGAKYLILLGDGCYDNRELTRGTGTANRYRLKTYQSKESFTTDGSYCTDDWFGMAHDGTNIIRDSMNLCVGRIPAYTIDQAAAYVDKVERYMMNDDLGEWKNRVIFLADDGDNNEHVRGADTVANLTAETYKGLMTRKLYFDSYTQEVTTQGESYPVLKKEFDDYIKEGVAVINYMGHGGYANLANEQILSYTDMQEMVNRRLPLWVTGTCNFSRFDDTKDSGGETLLLNPRGGSIAMVSTTRTVYSSQNMKFNLELSKRLLQDGMTIGEAVREAKNERAKVGDMNRLSFVLLGDPALRVAVAHDRKVVCEFDKDTVGALDVVSISGEIVGDEDFEGYVHVTVFDKEEKVKTLCNECGEDEGPFEYRYRINPIYKGKAAVSKGRFDVEFVVPKDIKYNYGTARVVMYAWDEERGIEGNGYDERLVIGGEGSREVNDTTGPEMNVWVNEMITKPIYYVGSDAMLIVRMEDECGVNTAGSGIGHEIMMWLDSMQGVSLNNYYEAEMGSYQSGVVKYWMRGLEEGIHKVRVRSWDVANNSSTQEVVMMVDSTYRGSINAVKVVPNPAVEWTDIIVEEDVKETESDLLVEIFDLSGRKVWGYHGASEMAELGGNIVIRWDLNGAFASGVYYVRVVLGNKSVKTGKIVVAKR